MKGRTKPPDENDRLVSGDLPDDPMADVVELAGARWAKALRRNLEGQVTKDAGNAALMLTNERDWDGVLAYNEFADRCYFAKQPPDVAGLRRPDAGERLSDHHYVFVGHWLARFRGVTFSKQTVQDAMVAAAKARAHHPLQEYIRSVRWDGVNRLETWTAAYLGATDTDYARRVGRWWAISAVARALRPGCQVDHMLVLEGPQGRRKSTALRVLGGEWYLGSLPNLRDDKAAAERIQGKWIVEVGELDAMRGAAATRTKDWLTQTVDTYRPAYGRFPLDRPRSVVFAGTTNEGNYLSDPTGSRRFWPLAVGVVRHVELARDRDQLWAEAAHAFAADEQWWPEEEAQPLIAAEQEQRHDVDEWEQRIGQWAAKLARRTAEGVLSDLPAGEGFSMGEALASLGLEMGKWGRPEQVRAGMCLRRLGFVDRRSRENGIRVRRYWQRDSEALPMEEP